MFAHFVFMKIINFNLVVARAARISKKQISTEIDASWKLLFIWFFNILLKIDHNHKNASNKLLFWSSDTFGIVCSNKLTKENILKFTFCNPILLLVESNGWSRIEVKLHSLFLISKYFFSNFQLTTNGAHKIFHSLPAPWFLS